MKCPKCHADNTDTARFCSNCATQLIRPIQTPPGLTKTLESPADALTKGSLVAGKYRIHEEIGRGGMGVVYNAEDTTLARRVAIKVLPEIFTGDPERLARFEREAKLLASLNHPNIAAIHGIDGAYGKRFIVMELVDGETLAERLKRGPLSVEESLDVCRQIAEGVEAAHEKGIIHRDLKPANVKLTPDGKVKILDFGLAKAFREDAAASDPSKSPTITGRMTEPGVILGTAAYMSPEQAKGRPVDKRTDIWAFGCILYECLTGKRAFHGETVSETIAAILRGEPDWDSVPADTPGNVRAVLRLCLQKEPHRRLRDVGDARIELETLAAYPSEVTPATRRFSTAWLVVGTVIALIAGILVDRILIRRSSRYSALIVRSIIKIGPGHWLDGMRRAKELERPSRTAMAISNDGRFVVYSAIEENPGPQEKPRLFLRRLDQSEANPIPGTEGGINPFLSPDAQWVGFWADGQLKKVPVEGGVATTLGDAAILYGAHWGHNNSIVFATGGTIGLSRISAEGGKIETLTEPDVKREESSHRLPSWLPNGKGVLFTVMNHPLDRRPGIALLRLDTREWHVVLRDAADAKYVPTGHLVFLRQGALMAVRFDLANMKVNGEPIAFVENVSQGFTVNSFFHTGAGQFAVSDTGSLVYAVGGVIPDAQDSLVWVDQKGNEEAAADLRFPFSAPRLSPDGRKIAYATIGQKYGIYVYDLTRGTNTPLTGEGHASFPIWTPDGQRILFSWREFLATNLFWQPYDGRSAMERLTTSESNQAPGSWSADGKTLTFVDPHPNTYYDIALLDIPTRRVSSFLNSSFEELYPEISPDGHWIAYTSDESKRREVYIRAYAGPGLRQQVSSEGGIEPLWSRDGKQLFYRQTDQVWAVDVRTDGIFGISRPRLLFQRAGYLTTYPIRNYDLSLDSRRFLMVKTEQRKPAPLTEMILVQNWFEELKRLVPAGKK